MKENDYRFISRDDVVFTTGEKEIIRYFDAYEESKFKDTISELSEKSGVSTATISRFVKKVSFDSYKDFAKYIDEKVREIKRVDRFPFLNTKEQQESIASSYQNSLNKTLSIDNIEKIKKVAEKMIKAKRTIIFGAGHKSPNAKNLYLELINVGINTAVVFNHNNLMSLITNSDTGDVVIIYTSQVDSLEYKYITTFAKEKKLYIVLITNASKNEVLGDFWLILEYASVYSYSKYISTNDELFSNIFANLIILEIINLSTQSAINYRRVQGARQKWITINKYKNRKEYEG